MDKVSSDFEFIGFYFFEQAFFITLHLDICNKDGQGQKKISYYFEISTGHSLIHMPKAVWVSSV